MAGRPGAGTATLPAGVAEGSFAGGRPGPEGMAGSVSASSMPALQAPSE